MRGCGSCYKKLMRGCSRALHAWAAHYFENLCEQMFATQQDTCTKGPSLPRGRPEPVASTKPTLWEECHKKCSRMLGGGGWNLDEQGPSAQKVADAETAEDDLDLCNAAACSRWGEDAHEIGGERGHADRKRDVEEVVQRPAPRTLPQGKGFRGMRAGKQHSRTRRRPWRRRRTAPMWTTACTR